MKKQTTNKNERGVALIFVLFALLLLTAIASGLMFMSDTESGININYRSEQRAYFAAMAGLQEARQRLTRPAAGGDLLAPPGLMLSTMPLAAAGTGVVYITNPPADPTIQPWTPNSPFFDTELCHELYPGLNLVNNTAPNIPCQQVAPGGVYYTRVDSNMPGFAVNTPLDYKWVRITRKQNVSSAPFTVDGTAISNNFAPGVAPNGAAAFPGAPANAATEICFDGTRQLLKPAGYVNCDDDPPPGTSMYKPVFILTSLAVTPNNARRMIQMEVADSPPFLTNAALDTDDFIAVNGSSMTINGYDNCRCDCGNNPKGGSAPTCKERSTGAPCGGNTLAIFTSKSVTEKGNPAIVAAVNPATAENQVFPYDVPALIDAFKSQVGVQDIRNAPYNQPCIGSPANCGSISDAQLGAPPNPFPGFDPNNPNGLKNQVTYVPGSIDLTNHSDGAGVLIVDGDLTIHGGMNFYGLILVKGVVTFIGGGSGQDSNVFGSIVAGKNSIADNTLGGGVNIQYDRCALMNNQIVQPPVTLSAREITY